MEVAELPAGASILSADPPLITEAEARKIMRVLGEAENRFAASLTIPLYWVVREEDGGYSARNGSAFILNTGERTFGVTAKHVIDGWRADRETNRIVSLQLSDITFEPDGRNAVIAAHTDIDIATFQITHEEIQAIGKTVLSGYQSAWPPPPPEQDRGIYYAGFPGVERKWLSRNEIQFGVVTGGGVATYVGRTDVVSAIEREYLIPVFEQGVTPVNFNFGGISGGPMLSVIEHRGLRTWALAGVIYQGPNTSDDPDQAIAGVEIIKARRACFIRPDGSLDVDKWEEIYPSGPARA